MDDDVMEIKVIKFTIKEGKLPDGRPYGDSWYRHRVGEKFLVYKIATISIAGFATYKLVNVKDCRIPDVVAEGLFVEDCVIISPPLRKIRLPRKL